MSTLARARNVYWNLHRRGRMSMKLKHQGSIRMRRKRTEDWSGKQLYGQFKWETEDLSGVSWNWIRTGELKKETEGLIFAAQDQALRINAVKARIENQNVTSKCRMCGSFDETVQHILCSFPKLAQTEYKKRHDVVGRSYIRRYARNMELSTVKNGMSIPPKA